MPLKRFVHDEYYRIGCYNTTIDIAERKISRRHVKPVMEGGLPFEVRQPRYNAGTEAAIAEARKIMAGKAPVSSYDSAADVFAALDEQETFDKPT